MATRQYIGARYVPKFYVNSVDGSAAWESNVVYEPLTFVTLTNAHMYISKKQVPATVGTPASNIEYWLDMGSYNGFIEDLQNQIDDLVALVNGINDEVDDMKDGDVTGSLQYQINQREKEIGNRYFLFIGDSYDQVVPNRSWVATACSAAGINNYIKRTSGGFGFVANGVYTWYNLLVSNPFTDDEKANITDVVIGGGTNDVQANQSDVATAMQQMDTYLKSLFPNLKRIHISYMGWSHLNATQKGQHRTTYQTYLTTSLRLGWRWLNGVEYVLHNPDLINREVNDRVHPNESGVYTLGFTVAQALMHGCSEYRANVVDVYEAITENVTGNDVTVNSIIDNNITELTLPDMTFTAAKNLSSYFEILRSKDGQECNFVQYKYYPVIVASNNTFIPATIFSSDTKTLTLWLRAGATIASGATFNISTRDIMCSTI